MSDYMPEGTTEIPQGLENQGPPDHSEYIPPEPTAEPNAGETGLEISNEQTGGDTTDSAGTGNTRTGHNPAWSPLLEKVPSPFHGEIQPFLKQWDDNFQQVQSQLAPFKPFIDQQVSPQAIQNSLQLAQLINANPKLVYDQLGERFGFNSGQGQSEVGGNEEDEEEENESSNFENPLDNPNLKPYLEQQQRMAQYLQEQQEKEQEQALDRQIANEWAQVEKAHGAAIPPDVKTEMIRRSIWIADQKGTEPSIKDGYDDYNAFVLKVRGQKANNTAPQVFSGNGGLPSTPTGINANMSDEERISYIAQRAAALNNQS